eukprot:TRINITY_DN10915_c0_g1_i2.p1 TRINITY_DN10915_c0_g1~~TRINITY_DN10915_c0_g1_i2.p1  ORF type:complete len:435 (+),score=91.14 TRINITY_DN10915_c0_g1_i2:252-1556(+)
MGLCCSKSDELSAAHGTGAAPCALTAASYAPPESRFRASVESHERILQSADKYGPGASRLVADVLDAQPRASEPGKYGRTIPSPPEPSQLHNGDGAPESMPPELSASSQIALKLELVARIATGTEVSSQLALLDPVCFASLQDFLERTPDLQLYCPVLSLGRALQRMKWNNGHRTENLTPFLSRTSKDLLDILWPERSPEMSPAELTASLGQGSMTAEILNRCIDVLDYECIPSFKTSPEMRKLSFSNRTTAYQWGNRYEKDMTLQAMLTGPLESFCDRVCREAKQLLDFILDVLRVRRKSGMPAVQAKLMDGVYNKYIRRWEGCLWNHGFDAYLVHFAPNRLGGAEVDEMLALDELYQAVMAHLQQNLFLAFLFSPEYCVYLCKEGNCAAFENQMRHNEQAEWVLVNRRSGEVGVSRGSGWVPASEADSVMLQ